MKRLCNYKYSITYIILIVLLNTLFAYIPLVQVFSTEISPWIGLWGSFMPYVIWLNVN